MDSGLVPAVRMKFWTPVGPQTELSGYGGSRKTYELWLHARQVERLLPDRPSANLQEAPRMNREPRRLPGSGKSIPDYNLPMSLPGQSVDIRLVVDRIPAFTWSAHADGSVEFVNQRWREYGGLSAEESQGWGWHTAIHPEDLPSLMSKQRWLCR